MDDLRSFRRRRSNQHSHPGHSHLSQGATDTESQCEPVSRDQCTVGRREHTPGDTETSHLIPGRHIDIRDYIYDGSASMMRRRHIISNTKFIPDWSHTIHEITTPRKVVLEVTWHTTPPPGGQIDPDLRAKYSAGLWSGLVVTESPRINQVGDQFKFHNSIKDESVGKV